MAWKITQEEYEKAKEGLSEKAVHRLADYLAHGMEILKKTDKGIYLTREDYVNGTEWTGGHPCYIFLENDGTRYLVHLDFSFYKNTNW